jgi:hypothetical protein
MTGAEIGSLVTAVVAFLGAVTAVLRARMANAKADKTDAKLNAHTGSTPPHV